MDGRGWVRRHLLPRDSLGRKWQKIEKKKKKKVSRTARDANQKSTRRHKSTITIT